MTSSRTVPRALLTNLALALGACTQEAREFQGGLTVNAPGAAPGYVLYAPLTATTTFLVDREGKVRHSWKNPLSTLSLYLLDDGTLLRSARVEANATFNRGGRTGVIQRLAKDGAVLWEFELCDDTGSMHHDIEPLPNGNVLAIAWERVSVEAALALGRDPAFVHPDGWWPDRVIEIEPALPSGGQIVWEWRSRDHLVQDFDATKPNYGVPGEHPGRIDVNALSRGERTMTEEEQRAQEEQLAEMAGLGYGGGDDVEDGDGAKKEGKRERSRHPKDDWLHLNSIDYDPAHDLVLLSSPELNEIFVLDHSTTTAEARGSRGGRFGQGGDLLWRWGNPRNYGRGAPADQQLYFQHQPDWVRPGLPGAGHVTVFNNGLGRPGQPFSSIDELELPFDPERGFVRAPEAAFGPTKPVWSYSDAQTKRFYSFFISGCHRLANGNTFVCAGQQGRLFEVTPAGAIVWEYWNTAGGELENVFNTGRVNLVKKTAVFRATKLAPDHPGLRALGVME
ncbi:MAG: hypothetical protein HOP15_06215 [Planctomycetes bacterium]|nr:hypothetical protein [Planctomycetota bacterium]